MWCEQWQQILHESKEASDIHIVAGAPLCMRVEGALQPIVNAPSEEQLQTMLRGLLSESQARELERNKELDTSLAFEGFSRYRAHFYYTQNGLSAVLRVIPTTPPTLQALCAPPLFFRILRKRRGLILFCGATGSGKSSSIAAMLHQINMEQNKHIITIEDPIEFVHTPIRSHFSQRNLHSDTKNVRTAIRAALREDPDVIYIGELRDKQSFELALNAAQSGHLVFSTVHASSSVGAISRIIGSFGGDEQPQVRAALAESLLLVVAQVLVPKTGGGMVAAFEILHNTTAIAHLIRDNKLHQIETQIALGAGTGMVLLNDSLRRLVVGGQITHEQALESSYNPEGLQI